MRRLRSPARAIVAANVGATAVVWVARRNVCSGATRRIIAAGRQKVGRRCSARWEMDTLCFGVHGASALATSLLSLRHCCEPHDNAPHNPPATHPDRNHGCPLRGSVALCDHDWRTWTLRIGRRALLTAPAVLRIQCRVGRQAQGDAERRQEGQTRRRPVGQGMLCAFRGIRPPANSHTAKYDTSAMTSCTY
jgi:hypothetical protein